MKFRAVREELLKALQTVAGVVERRQTMPVLANFLLSTKKNRLKVTASDLEVELTATAKIDLDQAGEITIPGRKLVDICKALPDRADVTISVTGERAVVRSGKSRFTLTTLPATEFPLVEKIGEQQTIEIDQQELKNLLEKTQFAMANQDVRYYLNGLLVELGKNKIRGVATDGHRLAMCEVSLEHDGTTDKQVIIPRKGVMELYRMLTEGKIRLVIGDNHVRAEFDGMKFISKLIDGRFPDYKRVIPRPSESIINADCGLLKQALHRAAILSNIKYRGIRLDIKENSLIIQSHNPEQEEAEEELEVAYDGSSMEIGFNVNYLLDALGAIENEEVSIQVTDANNSCIIKDPERHEYTYVVMPMRL